MAHGKQKMDIHQEIKKTLRSKESFGDSKKEAKADGTSKDKIFSYKTAIAYNKEAQKFGKYVEEHSPTGRYTSLEDARSYAKAYIQEHNADMRYSAYTVQLERAALGKLFGVDSREFGPVDARHRADITRSRERTIISEKTGKEIFNPKTAAGHFSEKRNAEIVNFVRGTGLRRSELTALRGTQLVEKDGKAYLQVVGKGGRERFLPIRGEHATEIVGRCKAAGSGRVWEKVPAHMDVHHYRSQYATALYKELARPREDIPKADRYCCRCDLKGVWYDKAAMKIVSQALGHNRISVIAEHYLRDLGD